MKVKLIKASREDMKTIWLMQKEAFGDMLDKYQDYGISPATESFERIIEKYELEGSFYYFISDDDENNLDVGVIRIIDKHDGSRKRISPIWIMPEYRNKGYAQAAVMEAERLHGSENWSLDTILQEKGNLHLYEKLGYHRTGKIEKINERMDIVYYEKN